MSLCVQMSAVITRHSGGAFAVMRFLTAISRLHAVNLTTSGSVNGSTSRPVSVDSMFPIIGSILSVIIFFLYSVVSFRIGFPRFPFLEWFVDWGWGTMGLHFLFLSVFYVLFLFYERLAVDSLDDSYKSSWDSPRHLSMFSLFELSYCRE